MLHGDILVSRKCRKFIVAAHEHHHNDYHLEVFFWLESIEEAIAMISTAKPDQVHCSAMFTSAQKLN